MSAPLNAQFTTKDDGRLLFVGGLAADKQRQTGNVKNGTALRQPEASHPAKVRSALRTWCARHGNRDVVGCCCFSHRLPRRGQTKGVSQGRVRFKSVCNRQLGTDRLRSSIAPESHGRSRRLFESSWFERDGDALRHRTFPIKQF